MKMSREEYEKIKKAEKEHLRKIKAIKQKAKELRGVWADLYEQVQAERSRQVETFSKRFRKLPVVQDVAQIPEQLSDALDRGLDRMGLVRKSAAKPRRRGRRRAT